MTASTTSHRRKRPFTLLVLCLLLFGRFLVFALIAVGVGLGLQYQTAAELNFLTTIGYDALIVLTTVFAVLFLIASVGLWLLKPLAWQLTMIITGAWMFIDIWYYSSDSGGSTLSMLTSVFIVFYLVQGDVRQLFGATQNR